MASTVESDGKSEYVDLTENSPTSPANTPDITRHIRELDEIHEVAESELVKLAQQTVLFSHIDELELPELSDAETNPP